MFSFHHVALSVSDLERSIEFYEILGFEPVFRWQEEDENLRITHLKQGEMLLELFCFRSTVPAPESSKALLSDLPRVGIKHFGVQVDHIGDAKVRMEELGVAEDIQIVQGKTGISYFFIKDPSGILVEVVQDDRDL